MKLIDYIKGKRHGKDANQLEREAMKDPFLRDAIEGFDAVQGNHFSAIEELEKKITERQQKKSKTVYFRRWTIGIAATIALILGIGGLLEYNFKKAPEIAVVTPKKEIDTVNSTSIKEKEIESTPIKTVPDKIISQNIDKKQTQPKSTSKPVEGFSEIVENESPIQTEIASYSKDIASDEINDLNKNIPELKVLTSPSATALKPISNTVQNKISGIVVDENNEPVIGATVQLKGTNSQTISDINGKYELAAPKDKTTDLKLVANYIGYSKKEIIANTDSNIIKLQPDNIALNEVVVVGYGTQKKSAITGAVSNVCNSNSFGTTEFKAYYEKHRNKALCNTSRMTLKASFYVNDAGRPTEIKIEVAPCEEMEKEFVTILQASPNWTDKNRKEKITIRF